jgi:Domain of Unknown Function (DUF1080)
MRWIGVVASVVLFGVAALAAEEKMRAFKFGKGDTGKVPAGWKSEQTGKGEGSSVWKVTADETAPSKTGFVLAQTAESPESVFNLCVAQDTSYKDLELSVAFKAMRGKEDQGGGVVWRYQDADNYYICRMNPLESNFRVYKVVAGSRKMFQSKDVKVPAGEWHTIKIKQVGDQIECYLDDKKYLEAKDSTFDKAGKVGLWSKADAQTYFDSFTAQDLGK